MQRAAILAGVLALALAGAAAAHTTISGVVRSVDESTRVIELQDGRRVTLVDGTVILSDRRVQLSALEPGTTVIVTSETKETPAVRESTLPPARPRAAVEVPMTGTVARVDGGAQTIVLSDGRAIQTGPDTVVSVYDRPVELAQVKPGDTIVVQYRESVAADDAVLVRYTEPAGDTAVVHRGEAAANPGRVEPWPPGVPESEMMLEPQAP